MAARWWPRDTIAWRFAVTIIVSLVASAGLVASFETFGGTWALPPIDAVGRVGGVRALTGAVESVPVELRRQLAEGVGSRFTRVDWYPVGTPQSRWLDAHADLGEASLRSHDMIDLVAKLERDVVTLAPGDAAQAEPDFALPVPGGETYYLAVRLNDRSWLLFIALGRNWGLSPVQRSILLAAILVLSFGAVSAISTRQLSRPIRRFALAVRQVGVNPQAPTIPEAGPQELREVIAAFNKMRDQLQQFVDYRTAMLAAISHDLRTPLTRMRLRGELIADETQQARLFRDVDDMQQMIDGALAFFRGDSDAEPSRSFDLSGILTTIIDDYADQGVEIAFDGPAVLVFDGRPLALKRALANLIDNAVKYATPPTITLIDGGDGVRVVVSDRGPGLPQGALEAVFKPFYRVEQSRNRETGGVGLGLTSAQTVVRSHGGDITLTNRAGGGLDAVVTLPRAG